jgi:hypothetical protein
LENNKNSIWWIYRIQSISKQLKYAILDHFVYFLCITNLASVTEIPNGFCSDIGIVMVAQLLEDVVVVLVAQDEASNFVRIDCEVAHAVQNFLDCAFLNIRNLEPFEENVCKSTVYAMLALLMSTSIDHTDDVDNRFHEDVGVINLLCNLGNCFE